jgi:hypothetical protein
MTTEDEEHRTTGPAHHWPGSWALPVDLRRDIGAVEHEFADQIQDSFPTPSGKTVILPGHPGSSHDSGQDHVAQSSSVDPIVLERLVEFMHERQETAVSPEYDPGSAAEQELTNWWMDAAADEVTRTVPKAVEYGAIDLVEIGRQLAQAAGGMGLLGDDAPADAPARLAELGVYFYIVGKLARWTSAIQEKRQISDDTLFDIGVYVRMAQRIRHAGSWPGTARESSESERDPLMPIPTDRWARSGWIQMEGTTPESDDGDGDVPVPPHGMIVLGRDWASSGSNAWILDDGAGDRYRGLYGVVAGTDGGTGVGWYSLRVLGPEQEPTGARPVPIEEIREFIGGVDAYDHNLAVQLDQLLHLIERGTGDARPSVATIRKFRAELQGWTGPTQVQRFNTLIDRITAYGVDRTEEGK